MCEGAHSFMTVIQGASIILLLVAFIFHSSRVDRRLKAMHDQVRVSSSGADDGGGHEQAYGSKAEGDL